MLRRTVSDGVGRGGRWIFGLQSICCKPECAGLALGETLAFADADLVQRPKMGKPPVPVSTSPERSCGPSLPRPLSVIVTDIRGLPEETDDLV
jgi:hypothetical protein